MVGRQTVIYRQRLLTRSFIINRLEFACHNRCSSPQKSGLFRWPQFYRKSGSEGSRLSDRLLVPQTRGLDRKMSVY